MSSTKRTNKRQATTDTFDEEDIERFYQAHKRLKVASDSKDEEISRLKAALEDTRAKEEESRKNYEYAATFRVDWGERYKVEHKKAAELKVKVDTLIADIKRLREERWQRDRNLATEAKCKQLETEKEALQAQLTKNEQEHKALLHKFDKYKARVRKMGNEA